jgi:hypothetical protein
MHTDINIAPLWSWDRHIFGLKEAKSEDRRVGLDLTLSPYVWGEVGNNEDPSLGCQI